MNDGQQLERIFKALDDVRKDQVAQGQVLVRIETNLSNHLTESVPVREKVERHEQSIQRVRGVAWLLTFLWGALLTALGIKYGVKP